MSSEPQTAPPSALTRLLDELSWEGNARPYRGGGRGRENVLTAEVFSGLHFLPRQRFLGAVIAGAQSATQARETLGLGVEGATVDVLPGDVRVAGSAWAVQPDVVIETDSCLCFVEAKRARGGRFQPRQLARTWTAVRHHAGARLPLLLLIPSEPPPVAVSGHGRMSVVDAVRLGLDEADAPSELGDLVDREIAWTTWSDIASAVGDSAPQAPDPSSDEAAIRRLAASVVSAVAWHSGS